MPMSCAGLRLNSRSSTNTHASGATPARSAPSSYIRRDGFPMPPSPDIPPPHELDTSAVRTPAWRALRTACTIATSGCTPANKPSISPSGATPSWVANCNSKAASSSWPFSRAINSSRAAESPRKRSRSVSGSIPLATQWALNDTNRLLVSTPPQSISRAERAPPLALCDDSGTERHLLGTARELEHAVTELRQIRVVSGARDRALVVALHEHHALP